MEPPGNPGRFKVVTFLTSHLGFPIPSPTLLEKIGNRFRREVKAFAGEHNIPILALAKPDRTRWDDRKLDHVRPYLDAAEAEVAGEEGDDLARDLKVGDVGIAEQPIDAGEIKADVTLEQVVDVGHARHAHAIAHEGRLCRPDSIDVHAAALGGGREGGLPPSR